MLNVPLDLRERLRFGTPLGRRGNETHYRGVVLCGDLFLDSLKLLLKIRALDNLSIFLKFDQQ